MKRLQEIRARQRQIRDDLAAIASRAEALADDDTRTDTLTAEWDTLEAEAKPLQDRADALERVRAQTRDDDETGAGNGGDTKPAQRHRDFSGYADRAKPFEIDWTRVRTGMVPLGEVRARALDAVEVASRAEELTHDQAERVTWMLEGRRQRGNHLPLKPSDRFRMAEHILRTGSPEYAEAFRAYIEDPDGQHARAALSLTSANGGYLVPFTLDPSIILINAGAVNPYRDICTIKTTLTNNWNGVTSAGVNAAMLAEGTEDTDHSPTVGNLQITPYKASAWIYGSYEILEDSDIGSQLPDLLADGKNRLEESKFCLGSGTGEAWGMVTRATTVASGTVNTYASADVYSTQQALPARFRSGSARPGWFAGLSLINRTRQFDTAGGSAFWANIGAGQPEELLGYPIRESTSMVTTTTTGSKPLLYGDMASYVIVDRIGMSVLYEPMIKGANQRPTGQAGWFGFWRFGGDVATASAFRVLTIA